MNNHKGRFITLEGTEGAGKSSNIDFVCRYLSAADIPFVVTREPGGTSLSEEIRALLLKPREGRVSENCELLLMFAARAQHLSEVIHPALEKGTWVVCDRFTDATYAYQGGGRSVPLEKINQLEVLVQAGLTPDLTLLLDLSVETGMARVARRGAFDRFEQETLDFFNRVRHTYLERAAAAPDRFRVIDAGPDLPAVQRQIGKVLDRFTGKDLVGANSA